MTRPHTWYFVARSTMPLGKSCGRGFGSHRPLRGPGAGPSIIKSARRVVYFLNDRRKASKAKVIGFANAGADLLTRQGGQGLQNNARARTSWLRPGKRARR